MTTHPSPSLILPIGFVWVQLFFDDDWKTIWKIKELVVDFRRCRHPPPLVNIRGTDIERVDSYKYLGVHLNNKLDWSVNTTALHKKGQSRLYLLRRQVMWSAGSTPTVVASAIFYGVVCWGSSISTADRRRLDKLLKRVGSVLGSPLDPVQVVGDRRMLSKLASMLENHSHPMHETLAALGSSFSDRLLHPKCPSFLLPLHSTTSTAPRGPHTHTLNYLSYLILGCPDFCTYLYTLYRLSDTYSAKKASGAKGKRCVKYEAFYSAPGFIKLL
ncbi:hypothetical protein NFI96_004929 [Prochilodus magdalenae]|nr:hypothetical protein NFI96_004929 [Prochilodus magdalenae]